MPWLLVDKSLADQYTLADEAPLVMKVDMPSPLEDKT